MKSKDKIPNVICLANYLNQQENPQRFAELLLAIAAKPKTNRFADSKEKTKVIV